MVGPRLAGWVLARAGAAGACEALVGDLVEEMARGHSRWWVWRQVIGLCAFVVLGHLRTHSRVTPFLVGLLLGVVLLGGVAISSFERVIDVWLAGYLLAGTLSLFAHVMSRSPASRTLPL